MEFLQAVNQHWPVLLVEDVLPDLHDQVGADADEVQAAANRLRAAFPEEAV